MDTAPVPADVEVQSVDVLSEDELAQVVGGADLRGFDAKDVVYNKIGMCGCGLAH